MERTIQVFRSLAEAEKADQEYYVSLSPAERLEILLILREQYSPYSDELTEGFERVCREAWVSRQLGKVGELSVPFISREMLKRNKKASGRTQDLADLERL